MTGHICVAAKAELGRVSMGSALFGWLVISLNAKLLWVVGLSRLARFFKDRLTGFLGIPKYMCH